MAAIYRRREASCWAIGIALLIAHHEARAGECAASSPTCHLETGKVLLASNPKRAAEELLASYQLDERTDTLALYATALELGRHYAAALETWQRVIVFRESEIETAKEAARGGGRKAVAQLAQAQQQSERAAEAIIKLWGSVGRVRLHMPAGEALTVTRAGIEVDAGKDILVNAKHDELVFTRKDGSSTTLAVAVNAGSTVQIDAPVIRAQNRPAITPRRSIEQPRPPAIEQPTEEPAEETEVVVEPQLSATRAYTDAPRSRRLSRIGLGVAAGGLIAGGLAGGLGYLANRDYNRAHDLGCDANDQCPIGPAGDLAERSNDRARLAQIAGVAGGAMLVTGAVLWIYGRRHVRHTAPTVTVNVGSSSAAMAWRF